MQTVVDGEVRVSYGQMYVESDDDPPWAEMDACFAGQRNGLAGAAVPGAVWLTTGLHTGDVGLRVEVHEQAPGVDDRWEDIVEVPYQPAAQAPRLVGWAGDWNRPLPLGPGPYRLRWCAAGMEAGRALDTRVDPEPVADRYLLQLWPAAPAPDEVLRQTSEVAAYWHEYARALPSVEDLAHRRASVERPPSLATAEAERTARLRENLRWVGNPPLRGRPAARHLVALDRRLAESVAAAAPDRQRAIAAWAALRALDLAGLTAVPWIAPAVAALRHGTDLPPPFYDPATAWAALFADERVPRTVVTPLRRAGLPLLRQASAFAALLGAAVPDPTDAALAALAEAAATAGPETWADLLTEIVSGSSAVG